MLTRRVCTVGVPRIRCTSPVPVGTADRWSRASLPVCCAAALRASLQRSSRGNRATGHGRHGYNAATLVRIQQDRLSKRAQKFRRLLGLKRHNLNQFNASIN